MDKNKLALTGGAAMAEALRQINPDVFPVYPITPQTPIVAAFAQHQADGKVDTEIITVESEHSAISASVGSQAAGARTVSATSSQGLALMNEILYIASGMRLPIMMLVSARALSAPLNIHCDHSDVMGARDTGWIQIFSENVQEAYDNTIIGMKLAEESQLPVMVIMDGFITSHSVENATLLPDEVVKNFVGEFVPDSSLLNSKDPKTFGTLALSENYFKFKIEQNSAINLSAEKYAKLAENFSEISGRKKGYFEEYELANAESAIVVLGSTAGTIKETVDKLRHQGKNVGLLKINFFRPFPHKEVAKALDGIKNIAVFDRAMSFGTYPPLYTEIINSLKRVTGYELRVTSYVYGLGGKNIFQKDIEKVFNDLEKDYISQEIKYINHE